MAFLAAIGGLLVMVAHIYLVVVAFEKSWVWALCVLCLPFANIVFIITNWDRAQRPVILYVIGLVLGFLGGGPRRLAEMREEQDRSIHRVG
jgi:thiol:disulfide interchange protein